MQNEWAKSVTLRKKGIKMKIKKELCTEVYYKYLYDMEIINRTQNVLFKLSFIPLFCLCFELFVTIISLVDRKAEMVGIFGHIFLIALLGTVLFSMVDFTDSKLGICLGKFFIKNILHKELHTEDIGFMRYGDIFATKRYSIEKEVGKNFFTVSGTEQKQVVYKIKYMFQFADTPMGGYMEQEISRELFLKLKNEIDDNTVFIFRLNGEINFVPNTCK